MSWQKLRWSLGKNEAQERTVTRLLLEEIAGKACSAGATPCSSAWRFWNIYIITDRELWPTALGGSESSSCAVSARRAVSPACFCGHDFEKKRSAAPTSTRSTTGEQARARAGR